MPDDCLPGGGEETSLSRGFCELDEGGVFGLEEAFDKFLVLAVSQTIQPQLEEQSDVQGVEFEHICMGICGADDFIRISGAAGIPLRGAVSGGAPER